MMKDKKFKSIVAVFAIVFFVFVVLFACIPFHKNMASWIEFIFTLISIAGSFAIVLLAFKNGTNPVSRVYGFPILKVGVFYLAAQLVVCVIICIVAAFVDVPAWIALLCSLLIFAVAAIGVIATDNTRDFVENLDQKTEEATKNTARFRISTAGLADRCSDPELKKALAKLSEEFRFSDPVSSESTLEMEKSIAVRVEELKAKLASGDQVEIKEIIRQISDQLAERNRVCKESKNKT